MYIPVQFDMKDNSQIVDVFGNRQLLIENRSSSDIS